MVERAVATFGRLDMAYNNAGILGPMGPMMEETAAGFDKVNAVNLRGVWTCMKHELLQMKKQGGGAIVNCSSLGGLVGLPGRAAYHATKHGVRQTALTRMPSAATSRAALLVAASIRRWATASTLRP
jgi:NAD(P)-dependent dehydrogenase (short-subunit alcohol dehydrogenase family)